MGPSRSEKLGIYHEPIGEQALVGEERGEPLAKIAGRPRVVRIESRRICPATGQP